MMSESSSIQIQLSFKFALGPAGSSLSDEIKSSANFASSQARVQSSPNFTYGTGPWPEGKPIIHPNPVLVVIQVRPAAAQGRVLPAKSTFIEFSQRPARVQSSLSFACARGPWPCGEYIIHRYPVVTQFQVSLSIIHPNPVTSSIEIQSPSNLFELEAQPRLSSKFSRHRTCLSSRLETIIHPT